MNMVQNKWKVAAAAAIAAGVAVGFLFAGTPSQAQLPGGFQGLRDLAGPAEGRLPGEVSKEAVAKARMEDRIPVVWLGERFGQFALTRYGEIADTPRPSARSTTQAPVLRIVLFYGDCKESEGNEPSCAAPIQVHITAPGVVPSPEEIVAMPGWSKVVVNRGLKSIQGEGNLMFWLEDGTAITVFAPVELRQMALQALSTANHGVGSIRAVGPGESLGPVNQFQKRP